MHLNQLNDSELWSQTHEAARKEKQASLMLLEYLREVQRRRLFASRGFGSLFEYVVKELKYSETQASERINAMRLMSEVAEVGNKIEAGTLSLTTASKIQRFIRSEKKFARKTFSRSEKLELIRQCENQSKRTLEEILFNRSACPTQSFPRESERLVADQRTELKFTVSKEAFENLERIRSIKGHDLPLGLIFEEALKAQLEKLEKKTAKPTRPVAFPATSGVKSGAAHPKPQSVSATLASAAARPDHNLSKPPPSIPTRYIAKTVRHAVASRSHGQCEYVDTLTGKRCESRYRLQLEHQIPFSLGGANITENLQHYCPVHNQFRAIEVFGEHKISEFVPDLGS